MAQRFRDRKICVVQCDVFADKPYMYRLAGRFYAVYHCGPVGKVGFRRFYAQFAAYHFGKMRFFQHERRFVKYRQRDVFDNAILFYVAEQRNLCENTFFQRFVAAQDDNVRVYAHALQFFDRMLGGFGLVFLRAVQIRHERYVDEQAVFAPDLQRDLSHRFDERLRFDIAYGAADLGNNDVGVGMFAHVIYEFLYLVGDMRYHLNGGAQVFAAALFVQHVPIDLAGGEVGIFVKVFVDKSFVVSQVEVGLRAVFGNVNFAVLIRAHRAGIDVYVRVELLRRDFEPSRLEQAPERSGGYPLSKSGNDASGNENILCHIHSSCYFPLSP